MVFRQKFINSKNYGDSQMKNNKEKLIAFRITLTEYEKLLKLAKGKSLTAIIRKRLGLK